MLSYFYLLYSNLLEIFDLNNVGIFLFIILAVYSQKFENHKNIKNLSNKFSYAILIPIFVVIITTGLGISAGQSAKFIYFDF